MKTATYRGLDGKDFSIEYDEAAPCRICHQPVLDASMGGTDVCPACDCGMCRYCRLPMMIIREDWDGGSSIRAWREHVGSHVLAKG